MSELPVELLDRDGIPITYKRDKYESVGFNAELADEVLAVIAAMPKLWQQDEWAVSDKCPTGEADILEEAWSCGTAMCFAGWAVALGHELEWFDQDGYCSAAPSGEAEVVDYYWGERLSGMSVPSAATYLLGINFDEADNLFDGKNSLDDLERKVAMLKRKYANGGKS